MLVNDVRTDIREESQAVPPRVLGSDDLERAGRRLAESGLTRTRRDLPVRTLSQELIERAQKAIEERAREGTPSTQTEDQPDGDSECPWCQSPIRHQADPYGPTYQCPSCGLLQHRSHWDAGGGCARPGCPDNPRV